MDEYDKISSEVENICREILIKCTEFHEKENIPYASLLAMCGDISASLFAYALTMISEDKLEEAFRQHTECTKGYLKINKEELHLFKEQFSESKPR